MSKTMIRRGAKIKNGGVISRGDANYYVPRLAAAAPVVVGHLLGCQNVNVSAKKEKRPAPLF